MGYILHAAVVAEVPSAADARLGEPWATRRAEFEAALAAFRESLPDDKWRGLVVGPAEAITNGYAWLAFLPDGSKEGWDDSRLGARLRYEFQQRFGGLTTRWGDDPEPSVTWDQEIDDD
jgi:hypothetical protein